MQPSARLIVEVIQTNHVDELDSCR
jgi:hypothetical protein